MRPARRYAWRTHVPFGVAVGWLCGCSLVLPWGGYTESTQPAADAAAAETATTPGPRDATEAESSRVPTADAGCGICAAPATCGGGGVADQCGCTPRTCAQVGATCGAVSDDCGATLTCGACTGSMTCGGGGTPNQCGTGPCKPATCAALGANCGSPADGCGGKLSCGPCSAPQMCVGSPPVCSPPASTCGPLQLSEMGSVMLTGSDVPMAAASPAQCQQYCNSVPGTLCCLWYIDVTLNGVTNPCVAFADPSCIDDWQATDASGLDAAAGGFVWASACL